MAFPFIIPLTILTTIGNFPYVSAVWARNAEDSEATRPPWKPPWPNCSKVDLASSNEPLGWGSAFNETFPPNGPGRCGLMVVWAGSPRAGSTLMWGIGQEAIKHLDVSYEEHGYWRFERHKLSNGQYHLGPPTNMDRETMLASKFRKTLMGIPPGTQVVSVKSHEFDSEIMQVCSKTLVVTTTRHPLSMLHSAVEAGFVPKPEKLIKEQGTVCSEYLGYLDIVFDYARCWKEHSSLHFTYEDFIVSKAATALVIMSTIAELLNLEVASIDASFMHINSEEADPATIERHANETEAFSSGLNEECTAEAISDRYGY